MIKKQELLDLELKIPEERKFRAKAQWELDQVLCLFYKKLCKRNVINAKLNGVGVAEVAVMTKFNAELVNTLESAGYEVEVEVDEFDTKWTTLKIIWGF